MVERWPDDNNKKEAEHSLVASPSPSLWADWPGLMVPLKEYAAAEAPALLPMRVVERSMQSASLMGEVQMRIDGRVRESGQEGRSPVSPEQKHMYSKLELESEIER